MPKFAAGLVHFQKSVFPKNKSLFELLAIGQSPEVMFITCSDSRIETAMLTQSIPGELFVCRNAGNIVPPHTSNTDGMSASIEYAVVVLKVQHIVVCGHTDCGAMKGAMNMAGLSGLPHVMEWLGYARAATEVVAHICVGKSDEEKMSALLEQNVILQLNHLRTHPSVAAALAAGKLKLHGLIYNIGTADITAYDEEEKIFVPVAARYEAEFARHIKNNNTWSFQF